MFYTLSKALLFLIQPIYWLVFILVGIVITKRKLRKKRLILIALSITLLFGNQLIFNKVIHALETRIRTDVAMHHEYGIVLGGFGEYNSKYGGLDFFSSSDRLTEAAALYKEGRLGKIIISSGVYEEGQEMHSESIVAKDYLLRLGIPTQDILLENDSWNTYQNAYYSKLMLDSLESKEPVLLITSAFHMNRAVACFEKQGIQIAPYSVDFYSKELELTFGLIVPSIKTIIDWQIPIKEFVGMIVYRMKGYL